MNMILENLDYVYFICFCILIGVEVITNVPAILHTPLMSGANAISGIITVGAVIVLLNVRADDYVNLAIASLAVLLGTLNISGGFFVTHRMLAMFKAKKK